MICCHFNTDMSVTTSKTLSQGVLCNTFRQRACVHACAGVQSYEQSIVPTGLVVRKLYVKKSPLKCIIIHSIATLYE